MTEGTSTTAEGQTAERAERFQRKRGAGFPVVALPEAVSILRKAGRHGNEHALTAFAGYLGHSTPNSGSFKRRIAAFRDWKFIAGATGDRVVFTDLGRRLAHPTDPAKEKRDLQEAFQNCALFWKVYDDSAKGLPISLATLANHGVQLGVAPVSKEQFAESLSESAVEAGFAETEGDKIVFVGPGDEKMREARTTVTSDERMAEDSTIRPSLADELDEDAYLPTRRPWRPVDDRPGSRPGSRGFVSAPSPQGPLGGGIVSAPGGGPEGALAGRDMFVGPAEAKAAALYQQSWELEGGSLTLEIRSNGFLPAEAFMQIGKVMTEVETLKAILAKAMGSGETTE